tara:strand:- start:812 stop:1228 length:417 start_codon:yes stop_codon:yes gene_type:complete
MYTQNKELLVGDVMIKNGFFPIVDQTDLLRETIESMNKYGLGIACITDTNGHLIGVLTDGDIRRLILNVQKPMAAIFVDDAFTYATKSFSKVQSNTTLKNAILIMEELRIWDLPIVDHNGYLKGLLHLHPAVKFILGI